MQDNKTLTTIFILLLVQLLSSDASLTPSLLLLALPHIGMAINNSSGSSVINNDVYHLDDDTKAAKDNNVASSFITAKNVLQIPLNQKEIGLPILYLKQSFDNISSSIVPSKRNWILEYKYTISYVGNNSSEPVVINILLLAEQMSQVRPRQLEILADNRHTPIGYNSRLVYLSKVLEVLPETISRIGKISMDDSVDPMYVRREEDSNTNNTSNSRFNKNGKKMIVFPTLKPKQSFEITLIPDEMFSQIGENKINCMMPAILRPIRGFTLHPKQYMVNVFLTTFDKHFQKLNWMPCLSRK